MAPLPYTKPVTLNAKYAITWENAHGEAKETIRYGSQAADFINALFTTIGCRFIGAVLV